MGRIEGAASTGRSAVASAADATVAATGLAWPASVNLLLCHPADAPAAWLAQGLRSRGVVLEVVTVEALAYSRHILFRQDSSGDHGSVTLHDGRVVQPEAIAVLIDRVRYLPTAHFAAATPAERAYAESEMRALLLGWLHAVPGRVINPVRPDALGIGALAPMAVRHAAALSGLPTIPWRRSSEAPTEPMVAATPGQRPRASQVVIVFDGGLYGPPLPESLQGGVRELATRLDRPLLQVGFDRDRGGAWRFVDATDDVDFRHGGSALLRGFAGIMPGRPAA